MKLTKSYLTEREQTVKINDQLSSLSDIVVGGLYRDLSWCRFCLIHSYAIGFFLNFFIIIIFFFCNDIDLASYADDKTPYCIGKTPEEVISQLQKSSESIFEWFENNGMKANTKCHLLLSKNENFEAKINENRISNTRLEKLLGLTYDN